MERTHPGPRGAPGFLVREGPVFREEAPGVFSVASRFVDGKNGIVVGERGAVAIDCGNYVDEALAMADFIREQGHETNDVVLTHDRGERPQKSRAGSRRLRVSRIRPGREPG